MKRLMVWLILLAVAAAAVAAAGPALAKKPKNPDAHAGSKVVPDKKAKKAEKAMIQVITEKLKSGDKVQVDQAVGDIRNLVSRDPTAASKELRKTWIALLFDAQHYNEVADLSLLVVLARPSHTTSVDELLQHRVRAMLKAGKAQEALADAKGLF